MHQVAVVGQQVVRPAIEPARIVELEAQAPVALDRASSSVSGLKTIRR